MRSLLEEFNLSQVGATLVGGDAKVLVAGVSDDGEADIACGGIGQYRLCMFLLRKAHIGEIQSAIWPDSMRRACREAGIDLA